MHVAVLGTGMVGDVVVRQLAKSRAIDRVLAVDAVQERVDRCVAAVNRPNVSGKAIDLGDERTVTGLLREVDIAISCLPYALCEQTTRAAIAAGCHLVDLSKAYYLERLGMADSAKAADVLIVPGCGVAPGIVSILAARGIELMDEAEEAVMLCGGLPRHPLPPLSYQVVFNVDSLFRLYRSHPIAAENGEVVHLAPLSGLEQITFPEPVGECEAVFTDAGTLPYTLRHKVKRVYEKTVRYKGHWSKMSALAELGFLNDSTVEVDGAAVSPLQVTKRLLAPLMKGASQEDITVARVIVNGLKGGKTARMQWEMIDQYDPRRNMTSMARTTGFPAAIVAEWLAEGRIAERGVLTPEQIVTGDRFDLFISALKAEGITIDCAESSGTLPGAKTTGAANSGS